MKLRRKGLDQVSGFLDKGTNVTGELEFAGTLRIDGIFHGSISSRDVLVIGTHAVVHADIKVGELEIHGQVFGNIECKRRIEVLSTGRVCGDIHTPVLVISEGALIDGRTQMTGGTPDETTLSTRSLTQDGAQERF
jgi:cytoskeletal protein CcmA (bactofilin family)